MFRQYRLKKAFQACFYQMAELQQILFYFYLNKKYQLNISFFEKKLFIKKQVFFRSLARCRSLLYTDVEKQLFFNIEHLSDILFSLHLLRYRVQDPALYEMGMLELKALYRDIFKILNEFAKNNSSFSLENFETHIHAFETIAHRTLCVVIKDAMVFLFFIQDLYAIYDAMQMIGVLNDKNSKK